MLSGIFTSSAFTQDSTIQNVNLSCQNMLQRAYGELWLDIHRKKTKKEYQVPLFPCALEILDKYEIHPVCL
jgi:hypothetical protein